jgi:hypothetical protein
MMTCHRSRGTASTARPPAALVFIIALGSFGSAMASGTCGDPATPISAVQGNSPVAALKGSTVNIEGIVVGDYQGSSNRDSLRC